LIIKQTQIEFLSLRARRHDGSASERERERRYRWAVQSARYNVEYSAEWSLQLIYIVHWC